MLTAIRRLFKVGRLAAYHGRGGFLDKTTVEAAQLRVIAYDRFVKTL